MLTQHDDDDKIHEPEHLSMAEEVDSNYETINQLNQKGCSCKKNHFGLVDVNTIYKTRLNMRSLSTEEKSIYIITMIHSYPNMASHRKNIIHEVK